MKRLLCLLIWAAVAPVCSLSRAGEAEKDVPWRAQAEIARRGAMVERVDGLGKANDPFSAIASAMQPPADDSHKWNFTLATMRNCQWCDQLRHDFENDARLKAWVDTKDYVKSWAHWQVVQIEDQSQAWRWKDYRPTAFPTLIVQPPVNGSWGDPHAIVFARQGYLKPAELDAAIRKAIQLYAAKAFPQRLAWEKKKGAEWPQIGAGGYEQARGAETAGGWTPPVAPPLPLPPVPTYPQYPSVPPTVSPVEPNTAVLLAQLLSSLFSGAGMANVLLLAILAWQIFRAFAKREGIPLLVDDAAAAQIAELLQSLPRAQREAELPSSRPGSRAGSNA
jgi:hypothetical protein